MYLIILCGVFVLATSICVYRFTNEIGSTIIGTITSIAVLNVLSMLVSMVVNHNMQLAAPQIVSEYKLKAFRNSSSMNGSFVLGTGTMHSTQEYIFYVVLNDGSYIQKSVRTSTAKIFETDDQTPHVKKILQSKEKSNWSWLPPESQIVYDIYIPKGSLVTEYHVK